jgi:stage V sporulation protein G
MKITEVTVSIMNEERLKAFVNITFEGVFVVRGLKVIDGKDGLFICMPNRKLEKGGHRDVAHPVCNAFRKDIEERVLEAYYRAVRGEEIQTPLRPPALESEAQIEV